MKLKFEVDRALLSILEGLEKCGPAFKPNGVGREVRKRWAPKRHTKPVCNPKTDMQFEDVLGFGRGVRGPEFSPYASTVLSQEVVSVPVTGSGGVRYDGSSSVRQRVPVAQEVVLVSATANLDVRQAGSSPTKTDSVDDPFLLLPIGQLGA